ncbi:hypothetical protein K6959_16505 [Bacillus aquiflavi]|uniref:hypothetical protein n=1 Tax=Bacillus aquiflavi TaxID=2672567 RepID=UPI001CA9A094|nr:hypothetical protein [Bacillus aquiflavi]UAC48148.1 hypothetical protein K6959_16505 [Bacillus aquiflavi]
MSGTLVKTLGAVTLAGGIVVSGIVWTGTEHLNNIKTKVVDLVDKVEVLEDTRVGLENILNEVKSDATNRIQTANGIIYSKDEQIAQLNATIEDLETQIAELQDGQIDTEEIQGEINRLEGELETANAEAEQLEDEVEAAYAEVAEVGEEEFDASKYKTNFPMVEEEIPSVTDDGSLSATHLEILTNVDNLRLIQNSYGVKLTKVGQMNIPSVSYFIEGDSLVTSPTAEQMEQLKSIARQVNRDIKIKSAGGHDLTTITLY